MKLWAVFVALFLAAGCRGESKPEAGRYVDRENGFSIMLPGAWEKRESGSAAIPLLALSPPESPQDPFRENLNVAVEPVPRGATVESYFNGGLKTLNESTKDYREIAQGKGKIGKETARWIMFTHKMEGLNLEVLSYFLVKRDRGFLITFTALQSAFPQRQKEFEATAQTFRFE